MRQESRQQPGQKPGQAGRLAATPADAAPVMRPRTAGLPGADRRILRKRLVQPVERGEQRPQGARTASR